MVRGARPVPLSVRAVAHQALVAVTPRRRSQHPVQQDGHGGRHHGGADGDQGNLLARHAACADHPDRGWRNRRDGGGPGSAWRRYRARESGGTDGGESEQAADDSGQDRSEPAEA